MKINSNHRDLLFTLLNQMWRLISGPLTMLLIPLYLSATEQGYWYLFGSLSVLSVLADLGFSIIILQFAAYEFAHLSFNNKGLLEGKDIHLKKLGSFFRFIIKWISTICLIIFPIIYVIGIWFFDRDDLLAKYILPWSIFLFGSVINFFNNAITSYVEALNKIEVVQRIRLVVAVLNTAVIVIVILLGGNIYALALGSFLSAFITSIFILVKFSKILSQLLNISKNFVYIWRKEVIPLFGKYSISFISGYLSFQIYIPVMQYFHGPIESGKVGITLVLVNAIYNMSYIWVYTITPQMSIFVSQHNKKSLDILFEKRLILALLTYVIMTVSAFVFLMVFKDLWIFQKLITRFMSWEAVLMLFVIYLFQLMINSWLTYLRAHKKEPYMIPSVILAVWIVLTTIYIGNNFAPDYFFVGFLSSYIWWLPVAYIIYKRCQRKWYL